MDLGGSTAVSVVVYQKKKYIHIWYIFNEYNTTEFISLITQTAIGHIEKNIYMIY
jgi:hypothetical protein